MLRTPAIIEKSIHRLDEKFAANSVTFIPGDCFFISHIDLPSDINDGDIYGFIELALEGTSPFPVEQLFWGYLTDTTASKVIVYATPKSRLRQINPDAEHKALQLFPSFLPFLRRKDSINYQLVLEAESLSLLIFDDTSTLPQTIVSRRYKGDANDIENIQALASQIAKSAGLPADAYKSIALAIGNNSPQSDGRGRLQFKFHTISLNGNTREESLELKLSNSAIWNADLRDETFAQKESKSRRQSRILWKSLIYATGTLAVLVLLQISLWVFYALISFQEKRIDELEPVVTHISNKILLAERLTQSTEQDIRPFVMLEVINPLRPDSIYFRKVGARRFNELEIDGDSSQGITPVNAYADSLLQLDFVSAVQNNPETKNNRTQFEYRIQFSSLPDIQIEIPKEETEDSVQEEEPS